MPRVSPRAVAQAAGQLLGRLARALDQLWPVVRSQPVRGSAHIQRSDDLARGRPYRGGHSVQADLELLEGAGVAGVASGDQLRLELGAVHYRVRRPPLQPSLEDG